jgi:8-oxo-dGTP diphosphatase
VTQYVVGFLHDGQSVVMVRKNRPEWQAGKLNGVGGRIEDGERSYDAMVREFHEETGCKIFGWRYFLTLESGEHLIDFYAKKEPSYILDLVQTVEDEEILVKSLDNILADEYIPNLSWIIPLAMYTHDEYEPLWIREKDV